MKNQMEEEKQVEKRKGRCKKGKDIFVGYDGFVVGGRFDENETDNDNEQN